jgi:hypothetical protein
MGQSKKTVGDVKAMLVEAADEGVLSAKSLAVIDINDTVLAGVCGMDVEDITATDITLLTLIYDDSGSIRFTGLTDAVREGQNLMLDAIAGSKQKNNILIAQWKLGSQSELIHSYLPVDQAVRLNKSNYNPQSGTALYDVWVEVAAANVAYAQQLRASGTPVKSIVSLVTDGFDQGSRKYRQADCKRLNKDLLASEQFIVAFVGVAEPGNEQSFKDVAREMGFPDGSILTPNDDPSEVRKALGLVSQSAIRASQKVISVAAQNSFFSP